MTGRPPAVLARAASHSPRVNGAVPRPAYGSYGPGPGRVKQRQHSASAGRRAAWPNDQWLWLALRGDRLVARAGWWSRAGDQHPLLMDIFDIDDDTDDGVRLLKTALPAVVPAGATPPEYGRFLPADGATTNTPGGRSTTGWGHWNVSEQSCSSNGCAWNGDPVRPLPNSGGDSPSGRFATRASSSNS
jgi:hypothetical protein